MRRILGVEKFRLLLLLLVLLPLLAYSASCGGGGGGNAPPADEDADRTLPPPSDNDCPFGCPDGDEDDENIDGDGSEDDTGDTLDDIDDDSIDASDAEDIDGIDRTDDMDADDDFERGEIDSNQCLDPENDCWEEYEGQNCECLSDDDCDAGELCGEDCFCHLIGADEDIFEREEGVEYPPTICDDGLPACEAHEDCPLGSLCAILFGCCDYDTKIGCASSADCPYGYHCDPYCGEQGCCTYECLQDFRCHDLYGEDYYCDEQGFCRLEGGDEDEEIEPFTCSSCQDCLDEFGEGYYCNIDDRECQRGECCLDSDCTEEPNGVCNLHTGQCDYIPVDPSGLITGTLFIDDSYGEWGFPFMVELRDHNNTLLAVKDSLIPRQSEENEHLYTASYYFRDLDEGTYYLYAYFEDDTTLAYETPKNPVTISYASEASYIHNDVDFFIDTVDPDAAAIEGIITVGDSVNSLRVWMNLLELNAANEIIVHELDFYLAYRGRDNPFRIDNIYDGTYFLEAYAYPRGVLEYQYILNPIEIDLAQTNLYDGFALHFTEQSEPLGSISGVVQYIDDYEGYEFNVYLTDAIDFSYYIAKANLSALEEGLGYEFNFPNLQTGSYYIRAEAKDGETLVRKRPDEYSFDIVEGEAVQNDVGDLLIDFNTPPARAR